MYGNNITAAKMYRLRVALFSIEEVLPNIGIGNKKYFFPETPVLDNSTIVGIEAHIAQQGLTAGDISVKEGGFKNINFGNAQKVLVTIYGSDKTQSFSNIPLVSLFPNSAGTVKRVNPYFGNINTRMSYCILSLPTGTSFNAKTFVNLTFYYHPKK